MNKEDYAVFFARLIPEKGLFEIPKIWKKVREKVPNAKLVVLGKFFNDKFKRRFMSLIDDLGIEYRGFVSKEELYKTVAKAKVIVYPTHFDAFPLGTLESLTLKTPVVAYDIPSVREMFGSLKAVKLVREFDVEGMAEKTVEVLKAKDYSDWFDEKDVEFINLYKSWEKVADAEYNALKEFLNSVKPSF
nr:glycosyltransferase [Acidianus sp. RZ1]